MYSVLLIIKPITSKSLFGLPRTCSNINKYYLRNMSKAANLKAENQDSDSKSYKKINSGTNTADQFGALKNPLEKNFKLNRFSSHNPKVHKKKIIKIPQNDESDIFGKLSERSPMWYPEFNEEPKQDNDLSDDSVIIKNLGKRYRCPRQYLREMKRLVNEKKVKEALDLFVDMRRNFVAPIHPHYTYMIGVCGTIGYTEMAFSLLKQMTDRKFRPTSATLTGLFNACAESPFPEYGLKKAHLLKEKIELKNWTLNQITYRSMVKAFGKCGDLKMAFQVVDEMAKADIEIDVRTYSFLLMSCISNKEVGFTYAVEVWRKMKAKNCKPNIFTCNLLLRAARDCDVGPEDISCLLLQHWSSFSKRPYGFLTKTELSQPSILKLESGVEDVNFEHSDSITDESQNLKNNTEKLHESSDNDKVSSNEIQIATERNVTVQNSESSPTSLLLARPMNGPEILELVDIKTPSDRLSLIGGWEGFLKFMHEAEIKPDMKTFALLLECLSDDIREEEKLLSILEECKMKPTIDFFNILIKKRNFRKETEAARRVLLLINKYELTPDIMTFGALALGCRTFKLAQTFMDEMRKFGTSPNIEIAGSLARQACVVLDFSYMKYALTLMEEENIKPNERVLLMFEKKLAETRKSIILMEQGKDVHSFYQERKNLPANYKEFLNFYEEWLKRMKFGSEEHPWLQYKTEIIDRVKEKH